MYWPFSGQRSEDQKASASDQNVNKIANSWKLEPIEPHLSLMPEPAEKPPLHCNSLEELWCHQWEVIPSRTCQISRHFPSPVGLAPLQNYEIIIRWCIQRVSWNCTSITLWYTHRVLYDIHINGCVRIYVCTLSLWGYRGTQCQGILQVQVTGGVLYIVKS